MELDTIRARTLRRLTWIVRAGVIIGVAGTVWMLWPAQDADASFRPRVETPAFVTPINSERFTTFSARWPRIAIDEGHANVHTADGRYQPFARLMERDGFRVVSNGGRITPEALRNIDIFVTANALGYRGMAQMLADRVGFGRLVRFDVDAFDDDEIARLAGWVTQGGRALIVADHAPAANASQRLAAAFGVAMTTWWAEDSAHSDGGNPATLVFSRENGLLGEHAILRGRNAAEQITRVMTFTGQALKPGPNSEVLLRLSATAREYPFRVSREQQGRSAAGLAQAVAVRFGAGRVVVMGDAAALTAQRIETPGAAPYLMGMNRLGTDNQQFTLNIARWLMGVLE